MMIIEGADNLGKTTAAKRMVEIAKSKGMDDCFYDHMGRPPESFDFCHDYVPLMNHSAIQDRFHLGSLVWHDDVMDLAKLRFIEGRLALRGAFIVIFIAEADMFDYKGMIRPERELFDVDTILAANDIYESIADGNFALEKHPDFNVRVDDAYFMTDAADFPDDEQLEKWVDQWMEVRRVALGNP